VDVVAVEDMTGGDTLARELLLIKLQLSPARIDSAAALVRSAGGRVLSSNPSVYIVELAGTELEIGEFIGRLGACGEIIEVVRSGVLGIEVAPRVLR
jgi:acetolactate synthase small subunit